MHYLQDAAISTERHVVPPQGISFRNVQHLVHMAHESQKHPLRDAQTWTEQAPRKTSNKYTNSAIDLHHQFI